MTLLGVLLSIATLLLAAVFFGYYRRDEPSLGNGDLLQQGAEVVMWFEGLTSEGRAAGRDYFLGLEVDKMPSTEGVDIIEKRMLGDTGTVAGMRVKVTGNAGADFHVRARAAAETAGVCARIMRYRQSAKTLWDN